MSSSPKPPRRIRTLPLIFVIAAVLLVAVALVARLSVGNAPALSAYGPMVQHVTTDAFSIVWLDPPPPDTRARLEMTDGTFEVPATSQCDDTGRCEARFDGLAADASYDYQVLDKSGVLAEHTVRTAPSTAASFQFLVFGDSGSGEPVQFELAARMEAYHPAFVLHTGDVVYDDGQREGYPDKFYRPYVRLIAEAPLYPCLGNHDYRTAEGAPLLEEFVLPANGPATQRPEQHYWFDYADMRVVVIDTNLSREDLEEHVVAWLDETLSAAAGRWKVVMFHHPVHTNGKYEPTYRVRETLVPVMERAGVQLVLSGHNHMYERSHPVRDGAIVPPGAGTVYIVSGAGGGELYEPEGATPPELANQYYATYSFTVVDVTPEQMQVRQISLAGETVDASIIPRGRKAP